MPSGRESRILQAREMELPYSRGVALGLTILNVSGQLRLSHTLEVINQHLCWKSCGARFPFI